MTSNKVLLLAELAEAERDLAEVMAQLAEKPDLGPGTGSTGAALWEMALARREHIETQIKALRLALDRAEKGTYGRCQVCGAEIDPERLEIVLTATTCVSCARRARGT